MYSYSLGLIMPGFRPREACDFTVETFPAPLLHVITLENSGSPLNFKAQID